MILTATCGELQLTEGNLDFVRALLEAPEFSVTAPNAVLRLTSQIALQNLASVPAFLPVLYATLQPLLAERAGSTAVSEVSAQDLGIWQTPDNVEWQPVQDDVGYIADQTSKKSSRRNAQSDDAWAAELQVGAARACEA